MRYLHDLSHEHKTTFDMGWLVPIQLLDVLPGDTFLVSSRGLARVAPLATPVMHNVTMRIHHWFVPSRLLWSEFDTWITGENDTATYPVHTVDSGSANELLDYLGIPPDAVGAEIDAMPMRAYNLIWNEFYRDQDLQSEVSLDSVDLQRICWEKDYLTTARTEPQQGEAVGIPISGQGRLSMTNELIARDTDLTVAVSSGSPFDYYASDGTDLDPMGVRLDNAYMSINDFRTAMATQRMAEARARYGDRYVDYLRWLGVNPSDGRLNRPEYLGGNSTSLNFSEVLATAEGATTDVGDLYGHGIAGISTKRTRKMCEEHGYILSLVSVRPKTVYVDGIHRRFLRRDQLDYWQPEFEYLPWQEVDAREVYAYSPADAPTWGYVPRFDEYRHEPSRVSADFRGSIFDDWHFGRKFSSAPVLNGSFVECTPPNRPFSDTSQPQLVCNFYNSALVKRFVRKNARIGS